MLSHEISYSRSSKNHLAIPRTRIFRDHNRKAIVGHQKVEDFGRRMTVRIGLAAKHRKHIRFVEFRPCPFFVLVGLHFFFHSYTIGRFMLAKD